MPLSFSVMFIVCKWCYKGVGIFNLSYFNALQWSDRFINKVSDVS